MKNSQCLASNKNYQANEEAGEKSTDRDRSKNDR